MWGTFLMIIERTHVFKNLPENARIVSVIPGVLLAFVLGCALNLLVIPIALLVGFPAFFYVGITEEYTRHKRAKRNQTQAIEAQKKK